MKNGVLQEIGENLQFVLISAAVIFCMIAVAKLIEKWVLSKQVTMVSKTKYMTVCAMLGALSMLLYLFDFPIPFLVPGFYKIDFSEISVMIGAFYLGPVGGIVIELIKILLKLVIKGTNTAFVGDMANFVVGCSFVIPASVIYHLKKTKKTAMIGLAAGTGIMMIFGSLFNAWYLLPAFSKLYGLPLDTIVEMGTAINPAVTSVNSLVLLAVAPMNLLKGVLISVPTMVLYKRISRWLCELG